MKTTRSPRTSLSEALAHIAPKAIATALQRKLGFGNSFTPAGERGRQQRTRYGALRISDVAYGSRFPNSYLDVYVTDADTTTVRPTYVFVHGGGFIIGSKASGDPSAGPVGDFEVICRPMLDAGFNVVSVGYALAPEHCYPTPVLQLSEAVSFLQREGGAYGIDMSRVVLAGISAGGQIVGQFVNIETNSGYARAIGLEPVMTGTLLAVVLDSAALDVERIGRPQAPAPRQSYLFALARRVYLGSRRAVWAEADVTAHVSRHFPPTFLADGNAGSFPDQARDLHERLNGLDVCNELHLPRAQGPVEHGFMQSPSPLTDEYNQRKVRFLTARLSTNPVGTEKE
ncbi:alpha/beta hydrolase [Microbacterium sp. AGC62]